MNEFLCTSDINLSPPNPYNFVQAFNRIDAHVCVCDLWNIILKLMLNGTYLMLTSSKVQVKSEVPNSGNLKSGAVWFWVTLFGYCKGIHYWKYCHKYVEVFYITANLTFFCWLYRGSCWYSEFSYLQVSFIALFYRNIMMIKYRLMVADVTFKLNNLYILILQNCNNLLLLTDIILYLYFATRKIYLFFDKPFSFWFLQISGHAFSRNPCLSPTVDKVIYSHYLSVCLTLQGELYDWH